MKIEVWSGVRWVVGRLLQERFDGRARVEVNGTELWVAKLHWRRA